MYLQTLILLLTTSNKQKWPTIKVCGIPYTVPSKGIPFDSNTNAPLHSKLPSNPTNSVTESPPPQPYQTAPETHQLETGSIYWIKTL